MTIEAFRLCSSSPIWKILHDVEINGAPVVVERHGEPVAAVVPMAVYKKWQKERDEFFADLRATAERVNLSEDEALALAARAVKEVRQRNA